MKAVICLSILGVLLLYLGFLKNKKLLMPISVGGLVLAGVLIISEWNNNTSYFHNMMIVDNFSIVFSIILIVSTILLLLFSNNYFRGVENNLAEIYSMTVFSLTGAVLLTSFSNVAMLFIGVEIMSIPLYILAGTKKFSIRANEASFKYFILGSFATAIFLLGIAFIYGVTGTFSLEGIKHYIDNNSAGLQGIFYTGVIFVLISFAFKTGAAPFHFWAPDVYEGSPTLNTTFMATVVKSAGIAAFFRFFSTSFSSIPEFWQGILIFIIICTLFIGNFGAIRQDSFKRLLAYSGISHTGFMLIAILAMNNQSIKAVAFYSAAYSLASILAFGVFMIVKNSQNGTGNIESFSGLSKSNPFLGFSLLIALLSFAGIPVTAGFFAKYYVFVTAVQSGYIWLVIVAIVFALMAVYYYFRIITAIYFGKQVADRISADKPYTFSLAIALFLIVLLGAAPFLLLNLL